MLKKKADKDSNESYLHARNVPKKTRPKVTKEERKEIMVAELYAKNVPVPEIAAISGMDNSHVYDIVNKFSKLLNIKLSCNEISDYRKHQGVILDAAKLQVLKSMMDPGKLALASSKDGAYIYDKLNNASRLAQGQATNNTSIIHNYNLTPKKDE